MKTLYVSDVITRKDINSNVTLLGWISSKRVSKNYMFLDLVDSTGSIQIVCNTEHFEPNTYKAEQSIKVTGQIRENTSNSTLEVHADSLEVLGDVNRVLSPSPRSYFDAFDTKFTNYVQENRHR